MYLAGAAATELPGGAAIKAASDSATIGSATAINSALPAFGLTPAANRGNTPRQSVMAAALVAARCGNLILHGTVHAHMAHGLMAARSAMHTGGSPHLALHSGECRLSGEERNHNNGDELEKLFIRFN